MRFGRMVRTGMATAFAVALVAGPAFGEDADQCKAFKWPLARERAWLAAAAPVASGATAPTGGAVALKLVATEEAGFPSDPAHPPKPGTKAGRLEVSVPSAGTCQVTLSDEGWIDVVQGGTVLKSSDYSGQKGCAGLRKSVRFKLDAGKAEVRISNVAADGLNVAFGAVE